MGIRITGDSAQLSRSTNVPNYNAAYTVSAWIYVHNDIVTGNRAFIAVNNGSNNGDILYNWETYSANNARIIGRTEFNGYPFNDVLLAPVGRWYYIAMVRSAAANITWYVYDETGSAWYSSNSTNSVTGRNAASVFGVNIIGGASVDNDFTVAHLRVWSGTALTQTQLTAEKNSSTAVITTNLVGDWTLKDTTDLTDRVNSRALTSVGTLVNGSAPPPGDPTSAVTLTVPLLTNTSSIFAPTLTRGSVTLTAPLLTNASQLYIPALAQNVVVPRITNNSVLFAPTVIPGTVTINVPLLTNNTALYAPTIDVGAVTLSPARIVNTSSIFAPTVTPDAVTLAPDCITNDVVVFAPTVTPGVVTLTLPLLTNTSQLFAPDVIVDGAILVPLLENTSNLYVPVVTAEAVTLAVPLLENNAVLFAPTIASAEAQNIFAPLLLFPITPLAPTIAYEIAAPLVAAESAVFAPDIQVGAITLMPPIIISHGMVFMPTVNTNTIIPAIHQFIRTVALQTENAKAVSIVENTNTTTIGHTDHADL